MSNLYVSSIIYKDILEVMKLCMEMSVIVFPVDVCQPEAEPDSGSVIES